MRWRPTIAAEHFEGLSLLTSGFGTFAMTVRTLESYALFKSMIQAIWLKITFFQGTEDAAERPAIDIGIHASNCRAGHDQFDQPIQPWRRG